MRQHLSIRLRQSVTNHLSKFFKMSIHKHSNHLKPLGNPLKPIRNLQKPIGNPWSSLVTPGTPWKPHSFSGFSVTLLDMLVLLSCTYIISKFYPKCIQLHPLLFNIQICNTDNDFMKFFSNNLIQR